MENLTQAIVEEEDKSVHKRAATIGQRVRSEDGVRCAIKLFELHILDFKKF